MSYSRGKRPHDTLTTVILLILLTLATLIVAEAARAEDFEPEIVLYQPTPEEEQELNEAETQQKLHPITEAELTEDEQLLREEEQEGEPIAITTNNGTGQVRVVRSDPQHLGGGGVVHRVRRAHAQRHACLPLSVRTHTARRHHSRAHHPQTARRCHRH